MPKRPKVWFGPANNMQWVDAPVSNFQSNNVGFVHTGTSIRGNGFAKRSGMTHREFTLTWAANTVEEHAGLLYALSLNEPLYYVDPLAMKTNILPLACTHFRPLSTNLTEDVKTVATPVKANGVPGLSWVPDWDWDIAKIQYPPGYDLWVGGKGDGKLNVNDEEFPLQGEFDSRRVVHKAKNINETQPWAKIQIRVNSRCSCLCAMAFPSDKVKTLDQVPGNYGNFIPGMGYGVLFQKEPYSIQEYSAVVDGYEVAVTASFVERVFI